MSDASLPTLQDLSPEQGLAVTELCKQFEATGKTSRPRIEDFLERVAPSAREVLLAELIQLDCALRREQGEIATLQEFQVRFPDRPWLGLLIPSDQETIDEVSAKHPACPEQRSLNPTCSDVRDPNRSNGAPSARSVPDRADSPPGYELFEVLGRGAMGVVYKARQTKLDRIVALKMIRAGVDADEAELARFRVEAEAIARLQHPNIVQIFEIGEQEERPFITLEFCSGGSLDSKLREGVLPVERATSLVETLARAMHEAHRVNVIHRDLKPANVLLSDDDSPKVTDFGLAKKLDDEGKTQAGAIMGTPSYMAPEQAAGRLAEIGPRSDVYALGAILYECLTGRPPFKAATVMDTLMQVIEQEPVPPRRLNSQTPIDLETICLKCLSKELGNRYSDASALADDLGRFQRHEPILARPIGKAERLRRWCRRNPALALSLSVALLILLVGVAVSAYFGVSATQSADAALKAKNKAEDNERKAVEATAKAEDAKNLAEERLGVVEMADYAANLKLVESRLDDAHVVKAKKGLQDSPWALLGWEFRHLWTRTQRSYREFRAHPFIILSIAWSPDGSHFATASSGDPARRDSPGRASLWDATGRERKFALKGHTGWVSGVAFDPEGKRLVSAGWDGTAVVWDVATGNKLATFEGHASQVHKAVFHPDGKRVASAGWDNTVRLWDAATGKEIRVLYGHRVPVTCVAFSPDGSLLASRGRGPNLIVWEVATGNVLHKLPVRASDNINAAVAFCADGTRLAAEGLDRVEVWDSKSGKKLRTLKTTSLWTSNVCFSSDDRYLAGGGERVIHIWDATTWETVRTIEVPNSHIEGIAFKPNSSVISCGAKDGVVREFDFLSGQRPQRIALDRTTVTDIATSPDCKFLAVGGSDGTLRIYHRETGELLHTVRCSSVPVLAVAYSGDGCRLAVGSKNGDVVILDAKGMERTRFTTPASVFRLAFSQDLKKLIVAGATGASVRSLPSGRELYTLEELAAGRNPFLQPARAAVGVRFNHRGTMIAAGVGQSVYLWDASNGRFLFRLMGTNGAVLSVAFGPKDRWVARGTVGLGQTSGARIPATVTLVELPEDWVQRPRPPEKIPTLRTKQLTATASPVQSLAFLGDGSRVAGCSVDGTLSIWDIATEQEVMQTTTGWQGWRTLTFSDDQQRLVCTRTLIHDAEQRLFPIRLIDTETGQQLRELPGHRDPIVELDFARGQALLASRDRSGTVRLWDRQTGEEKFILRDTTGSTKCVALHPTEPRLAVGSSSGEIRLLDLATGTPSPFAKVDGEVEDLFFDAEGTRLGMLTSAKAFSIWDVSMQKPIYQRKEKTGRVRAVAFHPEGNEVAMFAKDAVEYWDLGKDKLSKRKTASLPKSMPSLAKSRPVLRYSSDGDALALVSPQGLTLWNRDDEPEFHPVEGTASEVVFSKTGWAVVSISPKDLARSDILLVRRGKEPSNLASVSKEFVARSSADGSVLAVGAASLERGILGPIPRWSDTLEVYTWDATQTDTLRELRGHSKDVRAVAYTRDGSTLISAGYDHKIVFWDARKGTKIMDFRRFPVAGLVVNPSGSTVAYQDSNDRVFLCEVPRTRSIPEVKQVYGKETSESTTFRFGLLSLQPRQLSYSPDGRHLAFVGEKEAVMVLALDGTSTPERLGDHRKGNGRSSSVHGALFGPDGKSVVSYTAREIRIWDTVSKKLMTEVTHNDLKAAAGLGDSKGTWALSVVGICSRADGEELLVLTQASVHSKDNSRRGDFIACWDTSECRLIRTIPCSGGTPTAITASRDGKWIGLASTTNEWERSEHQLGRVVVLDAQSGKPIAKAKEDFGVVMGLAFHPDSRQLAFSTYDGQVRVWDFFQE